MGPSALMPPVRRQDNPHMKKAIVFAVVLTAVGALTGILRSKFEQIDWEKRFEALPDNAPPKWMFRNITAIRENTEKILRLLESDRSVTTPSGS